ncbi:MAG: hypothetical protein Q4D86_09030 [Pasteurella oralis]|uniref:hypothetical protein n=1 Tax=Pasteurella oralis TaxID=1071947 RepID=UPI00270DA995|nr:hypothetical protein [Pasteurella oralis]
MFWGEVMRVFRKLSYVLYLSLCLSISAEAKIAEKQRLLAELQSSFEYMEQIANSDSLTPIEIKPIKPIKKFDPKDKHNFIKLPTQSKIEHSQLDQFFAQRQIDIWYKYPYYFFNIPKETYKLAELLGLEPDYFSRNTQLHPIFTPTDIELIDGTRETNFDYLSPQKIFAEKNMEGELSQHHLSELEQSVYATKDSFYEQIVIESDQPLKQVSFTIDLPLQQYQSHTVQQIPYKIMTQFGEIQLTQILGNAVTYRLPKNIVDSVIMHGVYQDGRALMSIGSNSHPLLTDDERSYHRQLANLFKEVYRLVNMDKIKTEEEIRKFFQTRQPFPPEVDEETRYMQITRYYTGDVSQVLFQLPEEVEKLQFNIVSPVIRNEEK